MRILLVGLLLAGCGSLNMLRGYNAGAQVVLSETVIEDAQRIRAIAEDTEPVGIVSDPENPTPAEAILALTESIEAAAVDNKDRAYLAQLDHNHVPKKRPEIGSEEDKLQFAAYAGRAHERHEDRVWLSELSGRLARGFGKFVGIVVKSVIPGWLLSLTSALAGMVLIGCAVLSIVWVRGKMFKKAAIQMTQLAEKHVPKDALEETKGTPAQKVYYYVRDHGLLE